MKADITAFMDDNQNAAIFTAPLFLSEETRKERSEIRKYLREYVESSEEDQVKAEKEARLKEIGVKQKQHSDNRKAFHEALGRMVEALASPV